MADRRTGRPRHVTHRVHPAGSGRQPTDPFSTLPSTVIARRIRPCPQPPRAGPWGRHRAPGRGRHPTVASTRPPTAREATAPLKAPVDSRQGPRTRRTFHSPASRHNHAGLRTETQAWPTALRVFNYPLQARTACSRQSPNVGRPVDPVTRGHSGHRSALHVGIQPHPPSCVSSIRFWIKHHPDSFHDLLTGDALCAHKREDSSRHSWRWLSLPSQGSSPPGHPPEANRPPYPHRLPYGRPRREPLRTSRSRPKP